MRFVPSDEMAREPRTTYHLPFLLGSVLAHKDRRRFEHCKRTDTNVDERWLAGRRRVAIE